MPAVNPVVARAKFDREVSYLRSDAERFRSRGAFLLEADFPTILVGFAAPQLVPPALVVGVLFDFTDYDLQPPSVRFVNPFTAAPLTAEQLPNRMAQMVHTPLPAGFSMPGFPGVAVPGMVDAAAADAAAGGDVHAAAPGQAPEGAGDQVGDAPPAPGPVVGQPMMVAPQDLIQVHASGGLPFLCVPGVREFHEHPGHTGQPWELERQKGAGGLVRLVELVLKYGIEPIGGWAVNLVPQVSLGMGEPPQ